MIDEIDRVANIALNEYGHELQIRKAIEELAELIVVLARSTQLRESIIDEIADVHIMIRQLRVIYGENPVDERIKYKLDRLMKRMGMTNET